MRETIYLRTSQYGDKPLTIKRVVFNQLNFKGFIIGQFRYYKRIKFCLTSTDVYEGGSEWYEISISNPLFYEYMKEQANEQI